MAPTHYDDLVDALALQTGKVFVVAGAGVAIATDPGNPCASWPGLLRDGVDWCLARCSPRPEWHGPVSNQIDAGQFLEAATAVRNQINRAGEFQAWLNHSIGGLALAHTDTIDAVIGLDTPIITTNYDTLIDVRAQRRSISWLDQGHMFNFLPRQQNLWADSGSGSFPS